MHGTLKLVYLTPLASGRLLAAAMWVDRTTHPGKPLFNPETEGCLPMAILLSESADQGTTWIAWRQVPMPEEIGPPSLTSPILSLGNGALALSIETNKTYHDASPWRQKVVFFHSDDGGQTWQEPIDTGYDPTGRIFNWDQRCAVAPDGRVAAFVWTYDRQTTRYLNIHRRISHDHGHTWSPPEDLGFADQARVRPGCPTAGWCWRGWTASARAAFVAGSLRTWRRPLIRPATW
ncbi:MAG: sialidase family protein [Lacunisphaera sp.]